MLNEINQDEINKLIHERIFQKCWHEKGDFNRSNTGRKRIICLTVNETCKSSIKRGYETKK